MKKATGHIHFKPSDRMIDFNVEASVLDVALNNKVEIDTSCGGSGSCGACRVKITGGLDKIGPRTEPEQAMADDRGFAENERLACQIEPADGLIVEVPEPKL